MENKKVTVIVPVYNVEEFLNKCVESIVNQTYSNLEIILVDDGSPDNCPQMCDEWAKKDKRIKVIHKVNGGLSDARNAALKVAKGEYISFIDSDDYIHPTMIEKLMKSIKENNSHIAKCMMTSVDQNGKETDIVEVNLKNVNSKNIFYYYTLSDTYKENGKQFTDYVSNSACSCLYSKEILKDKEFVKGMFSEDLIFNCDVITEDVKISVVEEHLYYYFCRIGSIMHTYDESKIIKRLTYIDAALARMSKKLTDEQLKAYKFFLYKQLILDVIRLKDISVYNKYKEQVKERELNLKENYLAAKKQTKSFMKKVINALVHKNMFKMLKIAYKLKG